MWASKTNNICVVFPLQFLLESEGNSVQATPSGDGVEGKKQPLPWPQEAAVHLLPFAHLSYISGEDRQTEEPGNPMKQHMDPRPFSPVPATAYTAVALGKLPHFDASRWAQLWPLHLLRQASFPFSIPSGAELLPLLLEERRE